MTGGEGDLVTRLSDDLPALQIVLPLISAPLCLLLRWRRLVYGFVLAVSWTTFAIAFRLLQRVLEDGAISYAMGGWAAPWVP